MVLKDASRYLRNSHTLPWAFLVLSRRDLASCTRAAVQGRGVGGWRGMAAVRSEKHLYCVFPPHRTICFPNWAGPRAVCLQDVLLRSKGKGEGQRTSRSVYAGGNSTEPLASRPATHFPPSTGRPKQERVLVPTLPKDTVPATPPASVGAASGDTHSEVLLPAGDEWPACSGPGTGPLNISLALRRHI